MKTLGRILIIFVAAAIVTGALVALVNATGSNATTAFDRPGGTEFRPQGERPQGDFPEGNFPGGIRPGRGRELGGVGWMPGTLKNIGVIALLVALIVIPKSLFNRKKTEPQVEDPQTDEQA
jgi:hypothetical protein